jgi:hypothetical protein
MKARLIFLALVCTLIFSLCLCLRSISAETPDNDKELILGAFDMPAQVSFDHSVSFFTCFIVVFAFALLPQQLLIRYIGAHEKSPPIISPFIVF